DDPLELGLAVAVPFGGGVDVAGLDVRDALSVLEALATAPLNAAAFQLRPRPRTPLVLPAMEVLGQPGAPERPPVLTANGCPLGHGEVLASYSLWQAEVPERTRLLDPKFLQSLSPSVGRSGTSFPSPAISTAGKAGVAWHLVVHESAEAALYRRAAGDFGGRASGAFQWRGPSSGAAASLWALSAELGAVGATSGEGQAGNDGRGDKKASDAASNASEHYSDDAYEQAEQEGDESESAQSQQSDSAVETSLVSC
ncbi:unnamed protein product, partial [Polarella glacialis]